MRISDSDLRKKLCREILTADPENLALMAENLLGIKAEHDPREYCEWDIEAIPDLYCGAFDVEGLPSQKP